MSFCSAQTLSWTGMFIYMKTMKTKKTNHVAVGKYTSYQSHWESGREGGSINLQSLSIQSYYQRMTGVFNHLRNAIFIRVPVPNAQEVSQDA